MWAGGFWWVSQASAGQGAGLSPWGSWRHVLSPGASCAISTWTNAGFLPAWRLARAADRAHGQGPRVDAAGPVPKAEAAAPLRSSLRVLSASLLLLTRHEQVHAQKGRGVEATSHQGAANLQVSLCDRRWHCGHFQETQAATPVL